MKNTVFYSKLPFYASKFISFFTEANMTMIQFKVSCIVYQIIHKKKID